MARLRRARPPAAHCVAAPTTPRDWPSPLAIRRPSWRRCRKGRISGSLANPHAVAAMKPGETVLDLGSGAGFDCFLAARQVGPSGRVIGVDMTDEMLEKARANAEKSGLDNVEFRKCEIEALPVDDNSVDVTISNCVLNLVPDKDQAFREIHRVLKTGGRLAVSDMAWATEPPASLRKDMEALVGCIGGALVLDDYVFAGK